MAGQKGRDFLLKQGTVAGGVTTVSDCRTLSSSVNNEMVDITSKDSNGFRTLLEGAGTQALTVTATGVFTDTAILNTIKEYANANSINSFVLVFGNGDTIEGQFQFASFESAGDQNNEETYNFTLESSGEWTFTQN
jgi:TP901-1 family phage major tail protein